MKTDRELLDMLLEAIDYSFWNPTERKYNLDLTYPVIDKVKYIKRVLRDRPASVWHESSEEPTVGRYIVMRHNCNMYGGEYLGERFFGREKWTLMSDSKWAYIEDLMKL